MNPSITPYSTSVFITVHILFSAIIYLVACFVILSFFPLTLLSFTAIYIFLENALLCCSLRTAFKYAEVRLALKKDDKNDKESYRSISILPNLSKVYSVPKVYV